MQMHHTILVGETTQGWTFSCHPNTTPLNPAPQSLFVERAEGIVALSLLQLKTVAAVLLGLKDVPLNEVGFAYPGCATG